FSKVSDKRVRESIKIGRDILTLASLNKLLKHEISAHLSSKADLNSLHDRFEELAHNKTIYGVRTSVGALIGSETDEFRQGSLELLRSHAAGVGDRAPSRWVRAAMLIRAHQLSMGYSGI